MEEQKKKQEYQVDNSFEIEESNAMKVLRGKGEESENPHESHIPQKKVGKLENFWFLHKWHIGIGAGVAILAIVLVCQLIFKVPADVYVMYVGPGAMVGADYDRLENAFLEAMEDYNDDGKKKVSFSDNTFLTENEIERRKAANPKYTYDITANNAAYQRYMAEISAGTHMFCMLDPELYNGLREQGGFVALSEIFETVPDIATDEYGICLGDTDFYKMNSDIQYIPADTMIAVRKPPAIDVKSDEKQKEILEAHKSFLRDIVYYVPYTEE